MRMEHGEGWVESHRGKWRARRWLDNKKKTIGTFDTKEEAELACKGTAQRLAVERPIAGETLASWGEKWLNERETDGHHRDVANDRHCFKRVTSAPIAQLPLVQVTPRDVREWIAEQLKARPRPARQTVVNALNLLRVCLRAAADKDHVTANPAADIRVPKMARTTEQWTWLYAEEVDALLDAEGEDRDLFAVAIYTGVRAGELFGLHWADVDLDNMKIKVRFSWQGKPTKGGRVREVDLLLPALEALERQRKRWPASPYVFPAVDGQLRTKNQKPGLAQALRAAGIKRRVRFHDLRHTCASHLIQGTWVPQFLRAPLRLEEVQHWLGHTSFTATQRYAHIGSLSKHVVRRPPRAEKRPPKRPPQVVSLAERRARK